MYGKRKEVMKRDEGALRKLTATFGLLEETAECSKAEHLVWMAIQQPLA
jgi:hypothetical protein